MLHDGGTGGVFRPSYPLNARADIGPLVSDLNAASEDIVAALPSDVTFRTATQLIAGRETPYAVTMGNGDAVCLERGEGATWRIVWLVTTKQLETLAG